MQVDHRKLRYLYEVVQCGGVRPASEKLSIAASVISRQIAQLAGELDVPLLERNGRALRAIEAGLLLIGHYREQLALHSDLLDKLAELKGLRRGQVHIVTGEGFVPELIADPLRSFLKAHPGLTVTLRLLSVDEVVRSVANDEADIGIAYNPESEAKLHSHASKRLPMRMIASPDHPLAAMTRPLTIEDVLRHPIGLMDSAFGVQKAVKAIEYTDRVLFAPNLVTNSLAALKGYVQAGIGVSLMPAFVVAREIQAGDLLALQVDHPVLQSAEAHVVTRQGRNLPPATRRLLSLLTRAVLNLPR